MAVQFKVPKSPKRDIAATDAFLGVDLTNTGVSIDSYRSPHAPNMIRNVPGKMRKRMGYYKDVQFGTKTNVNFASDTSAQKKQFVLSAEDEWVKAYNLIQTIKSDEAYSVYLEFDYASEEDFYILNDSTVVTAGQPTEEDVWPHFSGVISCASTDEFTEVDIKTLVDQEIYIKNFSFMLAKDTSYSWSPAPKYFVERETNDPVYGCHFLKKGSDGFDGDRVVNVNRALNTHETDTFEPLGTGQILYELAETLCPDQTIYIDFDYEYTLPSPYHAYITVGTNPSSYSYGDNKGIDLEDTGGVTKHIGVVTKLSEFYTYDSYEPFVRLYSTNAYTNLIIKNFSIVYEKDEDFKWSPAPEDNKEKFYIKDMYKISSNNYAPVTAYEKETSSTSTAVSETIVFGSDDSHGGRYQYISFDITTYLTNADASLNHFNFYIRNDEGDKVLRLKDEHFLPNSYDKNFRKKHINYFAYLPEGRYLKDFKMDFYVSGGSTKAHISISNLSVKDYVIRDSFISVSKWFLYHVGKSFYLRANDTSTFTEVYSDANEHLSRSWQINSNCYIIDGKEIYEFTIDEGEDVHKVEGDYAFIPTVTISKEPSGGGQSYDPFNCLQPGFIETFCGTAGVTKYQLTFGDLDDTTVQAWVADANMNFLPKTEDTDFTVNRESGQVTFNTAPGPSPQDGEPNVKIQA